MSGRVLSIVRSLAHLCRNVSAIGALFFAVRFTWLSGVDSLAMARERFEEAGEGREPLPGALDPPTPKRSDAVKQAKELGDVAPTTQTLPEPAPNPSPQLRRILVDLGPERSEVFLDGHLVGHTPYVGQVSCTTEAPVRIEVLPAQGAPIKRIVVCRGANLIAAQEPNR